MSKNNPLRPKSPAVPSPMKEETSELVLPSGAKATFVKFKGKHVMAAQRLCGNSGDKLILAILSIITKIDGKSLVLEDFEEMNGKDVMKLMAEKADSFI